MLRVLGEAEASCAILFDEAETFQSSIKLNLLFLTNYQTHFFTVSEKKSCKLYLVCYWNSHQGKILINSIVLHLEKSGKYIIAVWLTFFLSSFVCKCSFSLKTNLKRNVPKSILSISKVKKFEHDVCSTRTFIAIEIAFVCVWGGGIENFAPGR